MVGITLKDISKDLLMVYAICYEYPISFTYLLKLFKISKKYFWTFMEICSPMIKMGVRKASMIRKSVEKILPYLTNEGEKLDLTAREENMLELFTWFMEDSFSDGEGCLHISQFENVPFAQAHAKNDLVIASNYKSMLANLDRIHYITMGNNKFYKTSRFMYYMEKYCGDLDIYQINSLSIRDMLRKIEEGEEALREKERQELKKRQSRV